MARKRMIDPTIWQDEEFGMLSAFAKIFFIGLFSNADDEGRIRANPAYLKSTIFMYDNITLAEVEKVRDETVRLMKTVLLYTIDGKQYIQLNNWNEYQKQHKDRMQPSTLPEYKEDVTDNVGQVTDNVGQVTDNVGQVTDNVGVSKDKLSKDKLSKDIDNKLSIGDKSPEKEIQRNKDIDWIIGMFKQATGRIPADKKPRHVAYNILQITGTFIKEHRELFKELRGSDLSKQYVIEKFFLNLRQKKYIDEIEKLETAKLKYKVYLDSVSDQLNTEKGEAHAG